MKNLLNKSSVRKSLFIFLVADFIAGVVFLLITFPRFYQYEFTLLRAYGFLLEGMLYASPIILLLLRFVNTKYDKKAKRKAHNKFLN